MWVEKEFYTIFRDKTTETHWGYVTAEPKLEHRPSHCRFCALSPSHMYACDREK